MRRQEEYNRSAENPVRPSISLRALGLRQSSGEGGAYALRASDPEIRPHGVEVNDTVPTPCGLRSLKFAFAELQFLSRSSDTFPIPVRRVRPSRRYKPSVQAGVGYAWNRIFRLHVPEYGAASRLWNQPTAFRLCGCSRYIRTTWRAVRSPRGRRMAERVGFEPTSPVLPGYPLSRRALSTAQTPLRGERLKEITRAPRKGQSGAKAVK